MKRLLITGCLLVLGLGGCAKKGPLVARVGDSVITFDQFQQDFDRTRTLEEILNADSSEKIAHLDSMVIEAMLLQEAKSRGMEEDPYVQYRIGPLKRYLLIRRLYEKEILDRYITRGELKDYYGKLQYDAVIDWIRMEGTVSIKPVSYTHLTLPTN